MTTDIKTPGIVLSIFLSSFAGTAQAVPEVLKSCESVDPNCTLNGTNGAVEVGVDGYGNFGFEGLGNRPDTGEALLKQNTPATAQNTAFTSFVALRIAGAGEDPFAGQLSSPAQLIGSGSIKAQVSATQSITFTGPNGGDNVTVNDGDKVTQKISSFSGQNFDVQTNLEFELIQTIEIYAGTTDQQSILHQQYVITNTSDDPITGELLRYADFNLNFNSGFADNGAGFLIQVDTSTSVETQYLATSVGALDVGGENTSAAITAEITDQTQTQTQTTDIDRYAAADAETVKSLVLTHSDGAGFDAGLSNFVDGNVFPGQTDENNISANQADFAVAFRNAFTIAGHGEIVYTTQTLWGNQAVGDFDPPPAPDLPNPETAPIPGTLPLLGIALWGLMGIRRRRVN